jgi:tetratricopeptide (TPR) repeat protein
VDPTCTYADGEWRALGFEDGGLRLLEGEAVQFEGRCAHPPVVTVALTERWLLAGCGEQVEVWERASGTRRKGPIPELRRDPPPEVLAQGRALYKARDHAAAAAFFEGLPELAEAAYWLGLTRADTFAFEPAVDALRRCLRLDPGHHRAATEIGECWRKASRYEEAVAAYTEAMKLAPDYLYALAGRAECLRMLGRREEARTEFLRALDVGPRHVFAVQGLAAACNELERYDQAWPWWKLALLIEPRSSFARDGLRICEERGGNASQAFTGL